MKKAGSVAVIGYRSPSGAVEYYDNCGARCDGVGYKGAMYPAPWLDGITTRDLDVTYSITMKAALFTC